MHGHSFRASLRVGAPPTNDQGRSLAPFAGAEVDALRQRLVERIAPLDYQLLNDHVASPTDENLARWIRGRVQLQAIERVGLQSTRNQGVDLDADGRAQIWRRYEIQAAHRLPNVARGHKCGRMHGHGFAVTLHAYASASSSPTNCALLDELWAPLQQQLHYACLNDIPGLENPTSEWLAHWIWERIGRKLPALCSVTVRETASSGAHYDGERYRIWKEFGLDSAIWLRHAPPDDARRRVHGHTYRLRLHLSAPLDQVFGWTVDFGDVKELFAPVFERLDHQPLQELAQVDEEGASAIVRWVRQQASQALPQLERIDLYETAGCGAILSWGSKPPALAL
jgi:6-pyruvoyltetrahydropterin/6-carboxytetrahydropterin synthase